MDKNIYESNQVDYVMYTKDMLNIFQNSTDKQLIDSFNGHVRNRNGGWCHAKMIYLDCLQKEMTKRFDTSNVMDDSGCSYAKRIYLINKKVYIVI